jgi:hypothetical protein
MITQRIGVGAALVFLFLGQPASGDPYNYVDWTTADPAAGTAAGTITLPNSSVVNVLFDVLNGDGSHGSYNFAQTAGGANYWIPSAPYISPQVDNAPPTPDILSLIGGGEQIYKVTLSEPIKDPIMAIVSLGQPSTLVEYDFDAPFEIVSQGTGYWGGTDTSLTQLPGDILHGFEGHGTIRFLGTFDTFTWTARFPENWHGFTFGIRTTKAIEPDLPEPGAGTLLLVGSAASAARLRRRRT